MPRPYVRPEHLCSTHYIHILAYVRRIVKHPPPEPYFLKPHTAAAFENSAPGRRAQRAAHPVPGVSREQGSGATAPEAGGKGGAAPRYSPLPREGGRGVGQSGHACPYIGVHSAPAFPEMQRIGRHLACPGSGPRRPLRCRAAHWEAPRLPGLRAPLSGWSRRFWGRG